MKLKLTKPNNYLYCGMFLMILKTFIFYSTLFSYPDWIDTVLQVSATFCFVIEILRQKYSIKNLVIYAIITVLSLISCFVVKEWGMLITVITCLAIRRHDFNSVIEFIYKYELVFFIIHICIAILLSLFGFELTSTYNGEIVYNMGFVHRNTLSAIIFNIMMMWVWLNYEKIRLKNITTLIIIEFVVYAFVKTKTSTIIFVFSMLIIIFNKYLNSEVVNKIINLVSSWIVPFMSILFYYFMTLFTSSNKIIFFIDNLLTGRIRLNSYIFQEYGLSIFGQNITDYIAVWNETYELSGKVTFDCTYTYLMISRGIVWIILISVLFFFLSRKKDVKTNTFLIMWALYAVTEICVINCYMSFQMLLVVLLFNKSSFIYTKNKDAICK